MNESPMHTSLSPELLAEAFPPAMREQAMAAANAALLQLWLDRGARRFTVRVCGMPVSIPARLYFHTHGSSLRAGETCWLMLRCLHSRSNDGFARQLAVRDLCTAPKSWSAPFILRLIGEYVIEILQEIEDALSEDLVAALAAFVTDNPNYWRLTWQRVASYWDVYYRRIPRADYVGFRLVKRIEAEVRTAPRWCLLG